MSEAGEPILEVEALTTLFRTRGGLLRAVDGISFTLRSGQVLCIVGESGSGKSVTALSLMRLIDAPGEIAGGRALFRGLDLVRLSEREMAQIRGNRIGMIFQNPMSSLNPAIPIGDQIAEGLRIHEGLSRRAAHSRTLDLLERVGIADPAGRYGDFPHQFSGGMRQRVMIASAIACRPDVLIADEPTTALDVTIQAQILRLLYDLQQEIDSAMIFITHDLGVVATLADDVLVMYAGRAVEYGSADQVLGDPQHPYTRGLLDSVIELTDARDRPLRSIPGLPPVPIGLGDGCRFRERCAIAEPRCHASEPRLRLSSGGQRVACHLVREAGSNGRPAA
jgi:oligopeptide/dipeptide ABC transporter ATP-binding protein